MLELKRYNGALVTPRDDALLHDFLINDSGVFEGLAVTHLGANQLLISAGRGIIKGRDFTADEETILAQLSDSGQKKGRLLIRVDVTNDETPIQFVTQVAATLPALVQEDINRDGTVYELPLAEYDVDELQISNLTYVAKTVLPQGGVYPATCTYSSGVFTLSGLPDNLPDIFTVRFKAPADFSEGDTLSINALPYALFMPNQQPAQAGAFAANAVVSLNIDLATGKAFLAGGGGGMGEWEKFTLTNTQNPLVSTPNIYHNKGLGVIMFESEELKFTSNATSRYTFDGVFSSLPRINVFSGFGTALYDTYIYSTSPIVYFYENEVRFQPQGGGMESFNGAHDSDNISYLKPSGSFTPPDIRFNIYGMAKIPIEYWL